MAKQNKGKPGGAEGAGLVVCYFKTNSAFLQANGSIENLSYFLHSVVSLCLTSTDRTIVTGKQ